MELNYKGILPKNFSVCEKYSVILFIKQGSNAETYRVKGKDGKLYFLKLFNYAKLSRSAFDSENNLLEIEFLRPIHHPNIVSFIDSGELIFEGAKFGFLVLSFIVGETLAERISREKITSLYDLKQIISGVLNGLYYLHSLFDPIIHNEITLQNIMLDLSGNIMQAKIIDFGFARSFHQSSKAYNKEGLNLNYVASECFNNLYSPQSDLFSVGAVMYHLLFGLSPWHSDLSKYKTDRTKIEEVILEARKKPLAFPDIENNIIDFDESILKILRKALQLNPENRFQSANEFLQALNGEIDLDDTKSDELKTSVKNKEKESEKKRFDNKKSNKGFSAIAGMQDLKDRLINDVIDLINDTEGAEKYNISMPNGMLLYGPPGCGKTFFAERFAEETGFNFKYINPSDLASIFVHGTQEKIGNLFKEARENAPFIICLDEVSSVFPSRSIAGNHQVGEVDEFLTQLNNCGQDGIFVIALTNFPEIIDEAILRAGRLDIKIYVAPPDYDARKALFEMYLKEIPKDFGIDYEKLATITTNYVSSDIKLIVDEVARGLRKSRGRVTMEILENKIHLSKPSVKIDVLQKHEKIRKKFESGNEEDQSNERVRIGFKSSKSK
jgi:transitional endoplasmic reticulum ATPase